MIVQLQKQLNAVNYKAEGMGVDGLSDHIKHLQNIVEEFKLKT